MWWGLEELRKQSRCFLAQNEQMKAAAFVCLAWVHSRGSRAA